MIHGRLAALLADPVGLVAEVPPDAIPPVLVALSAAQIALAGRLLEAKTQTPSDSSSRTVQADRLLTAREAASIAGVSEKWLYRKAKAGALPFARRLSPGVVRFSETGLYRWLEARRA